MPNLTKKQKEYRGRLIQKLVDMDSGRVCPWCKRSYSIGVEGAGKLIEENLSEFNALVAVLCPDEEGAKQ